jgi:putative addiction module component (TIGR02574 family)
MSPRFAEIAQQALELPLSDRVQLAQELWASLQAPPTNGDDEAATITEAKRRAEELTSGGVRGSEHEDVMLAARKRLRCE